jgi:hypothetical protein
VPLETWSYMHCCNVRLIARGRLVHSGDGDYDGALPAGAYGQGDGRRRGHGMLHCHVSAGDRFALGHPGYATQWGPTRTQSEGAAYVGSFVHAARGAGIWSGPRGTNLLDSGSPVYDTYRTKVRNVMRPCRAGPPAHSFNIHHVHTVCWPPAGWEVHGCRRIGGKLLQQSYPRPGIGS